MTFAVPRSGTAPAPPFLVECAHGAGHPGGSSGIFRFARTIPTRSNRLVRRACALRRARSQQDLDAGWFQDRGETVISASSTTRTSDSDFFGNADKAWAINLGGDLRVSTRVVERLRAAGLAVEPHAESYSYGRFAELQDPEGNHVSCESVNAAVGRTGRPAGQVAPRSLGTNRAR